MTSPQAPAGWYQDPDEPDQLRYWDGEGWTTHTAPASAPPPTEDAVTGKPAESAEGVSTAGHQGLPENSVGAFWAEHRAVRLGAALAAILLVGWCSVETAKNMAETDKTGDERGAISACEDEVQARLKSPGTADFSGSTAINDGAEWSVSGSVDSQNAFGGDVRNTFDCTVEHVGSDVYSVTDVQTTNN